MNDLDSVLRVVALVESQRSGRDLSDTCFAAVADGATAILLGGTDVPARELARDARLLLGGLAVPLLLAGRADVAIAVGAAGVHLEAQDVPVPMIRRIAPPGFLIGASVGTPQALEGGRGADYWAIGPWSGLGATGFSALVRRAEGRPCVATGASRQDLQAVLDAGGVGIVTQEA